MNHTLPPVYGYIALFNGQRHEVHATSSYAAYQQAVAFFRPAKSKMHLVTVHLAEMPDGSTYVHTAVD